MKIASKIALLLLLLGATFAVAANNITQVQHVIIVIQENRTPDNLFNQDAVLVANGGHVQPNLPGQPTNSGLCLQQGTENPITLYSRDLYTCFDPQHSHGPHGLSTKGAWETTWDGGGMDGACSDNLADNSCGGGPSCLTNGPHSSDTCPYAYVDNSIWTTSGSPYDRILDPYFQIANQYGFANYMFQTNQGASFPAHQFLFSGTSAPDAFGDTQGSNCGDTNHPCYQWFDAENSLGSANDPGGCIAYTTDLAYDIDLDTSKHESEAYWPPAPVHHAGFPCYSHPTMADLLDGAGLSWRYYLREKGVSLWTAPQAFYNICNPTGPGPGGSCQGNPIGMGDWNYDVEPFVPCPGSGPYATDCAPILTDIGNCQLPAVSWVIPDGNWSDHANKGAPGDGGPSWVAAIVNAVGQDTTCENHVGYWSDTVILVTWDDWGGWYDDVVPPDCATSPCTGYFGGLNGNGKQYVYGFRVPLLVVSAYTKQCSGAQCQDGFTGYISGPPSNPDCAPPNTYCHDFGSILNFIEYAFGLTQGGIGDSHWPYADKFVMDTAAPPNNFSLYDFFNFNPSSFHAFQPINGAKYPPSCFHGPTTAQCFGSNYPDDPDGDANESD
jgi:phospholipase C